MVDYKKQGKLNRQNGALFEKRVREDLESKGWIVSKWQNTVELHKENSEDVVGVIPDARQENIKAIYGKLVPAKNCFRGKGLPMQLGSGFPDFIAYKNENDDPISIPDYTLVGVESKINGKLDKAEKEKCQWLLENKVFNKIFIAEKTKVKNKIVVVYKEFK